MRLNSRKKGISEVLGALLLMVVVVVAVGAFAYFLSSTQAAAEARSNLISNVENENLQVVNIDPAPSNPMIQFEMFSVTNTTNTYYVQMENSMEVLLSSNSNSSSYDALLRYENSSNSLVPASYNWINSTTTANLALSNIAEPYGPANPYILTFFAGGDFGFEYANWQNITFTIRNLNTQNSGLSRLSINNHYVTSWDELNQTGGVASEYDFSTPPLEILAKQSVTIFVDLTSYQIPETQALSILLLSSASNFFSYVFSPPTSFVKVSTNTQNYLVTTRDVPEFDGSGSTASGSASIVSYLWRIDVPEYGWNGDWGDVANIATVFVYGETIQFSPEALFTQSQLMNLNITGPLRVTLTTIDSNGLVAISQSTILPKDPNIDPAGSLNVTIPKNSGGILTVEVKDIFGRPLAGAPVLFLSSPGGATFSPTSAVTDENGEASTKLTWTGSSTVEIESGTLSPLYVTVPPVLSVSATASPSMIDSGQSSVLTAIASGGSGTYSSYQWYSNSGCSTTISGATSSTYVASPASTTTYCVQVTDSQSETATGIVTVTVNSALVAPTISISSKAIDWGQSATLSTSAYFSGGTSPYTCQWLVAEPFASSYSDLGSSFTSGCTTSSLPTISTGALTAAGNWSFKLQVTDSSGTPPVTSNAVNVTVNPALSTPSISTKTPVIDSGQEASLNVSWSGGTPTYSVTLYYTSSSSSCSSLGAQIGQRTGVSSSSSSFNESSLSIGTDYICATVRDSSSSPVTTTTSAPVQVIVNSALTAPTVSASPSTVDQGQTSSLTSTAVSTGTSPYTYQWYEEEPGASSFMSISGATSASYSFITSSSTPNGTWNFELKVTDSSGTPVTVTSNAASVIVNSQLLAPTVLVPANETTIDQGQSSSLSSTTVTSGTSPYSYQWYEEVPGTNSFIVINGANSPSYTFSTTNSTETGTYQFELKVTDATGAVVTSIAVSVTVDS